jgi:hypothetical protein
LTQAKENPAGAGFLDQTPKQDCIHLISTASKLDLSAGATGEASDVGLDFLALVGKIFVNKGFGHGTNCSFKVSCFTRPPKLEVPKCIPSFLAANY